MVDCMLMKLAYVHRFLMEYNESGDFSSLDILDHLGNSVTLSNNLAFLGKLSTVCYYIV